MFSKGSLPSWVELSYGEFYGSHIRWYAMTLLKNWALLVADNIADKKFYIKYTFAYAEKDEGSWVKGPTDVNPPYPSLKLLSGLTTLKSCNTTKHTHTHTHTHIYIYIYIYIYYRSIMFGNKLYQFVIPVLKLLVNVEPCFFPYSQIHFKPD